MKKTTRLERWMGSAVMLMPIWLAVAALYFIAEVIHISLASIGLWIFAIAGVWSVALWLMLRQKWLAVWLILKPSVVNLMIIGCQLLVFLVTRSIIGCVVITFLFVCYAVWRCDALPLRQEDRVQEIRAIVRMCNIGLIVASMPFLYQTLFMTPTVDAIVYMTGLSEDHSIIALLLLHVMAVMGIVQLQSVISHLWLQRKRK